MRCVGGFVRFDRATNGFWMVCEIGVEVGLRMTLSV